MKGLVGCLVNQVRLTKQNRSGTCIQNLIKYEKTKVKVNLE